LGLRAIDGRLGLVSYRDREETGKGDFSNINVFSVGPGGLEEML
jgi:hypothetical protein